MITLGDMHKIFVIDESSILQSIRGKRQSSSYGHPHIQMRVRYVNTLSLATTKNKIKNKDIMDSKALLETSCK